MFKATMDEEYFSPAVKFNGKKELFIFFVATNSFPERDS